MKNVLLVLIGLALGCGAGAAATRTAIAELPAAPPSATRWEQNCQDVEHDSLNEYLEKAGRGGWELAATQIFGSSSVMVCVKRPVAR